METDKPVHKGFLFFPPSGIILKKTWHKKYCVLYKKSSSGIARIEIYENEAQSGQAKIITLEGVIKIAPKTANIINVVTETSDLEFGTSGEDNLSEWFEALKSVAFPDRGSLSSYIEEENDLYCSSNEGIFYVKVHPSEASKRCNLANKSYILAVTPVELQLLDENDKSLLYLWPFSHIRKYGYKGGKFTFEAGRKCASGEGTFFLEHPNHNEIYRCLSTNMKNMKKMLKVDSLPSLINSDDLQLHAALSMEAGSRNPLPLTMSSRSLFEESENTFLSSRHIFPHSVTLGERKVPRKPPRKTLPLKNANKTFATVGNNNNLVNQCDRPENMKVMCQSYADIFSDSARSTWGNKPLKHSVSEKNISAPPVISEPATSPDSDYYDRLQYFGSNNTLNLDPGYKVFTQTGNKSETKTTSTDVPDLEDDKVHASWSAPILPLSLGYVADIRNAPSVIVQDLKEGDDSDYDHLSHFGNASCPSADYKQVKPAIPAKPATLTNLYEVVDLSDVSRSLIYNPSGYACINKPSTTECDLEVPNREPAPSIAHQIHNNQPYAVVSRTKPGVDAESSNQLIPKRV